MLRFAGEHGYLNRERQPSLSTLLHAIAGLATPDRAVAQIAGSAMRMKTAHLRAELRFGSPLQRLLLRDELLLRGQQVVLECFHPGRQTGVFLLEVRNLRRRIAAA